MINKTKIAVITVISIVLLMFICGCAVSNNQDNNSVSNSQENNKGIMDCQQRIYYIGETYKLANGAEVTMSVDKEKQLFTFKFTANEEYMVQQFYFGFHKELLGEYSKNSRDFNYVDDQGNGISFNQDGYYYFTGDKAIYISYASANEEIKRAIAEDRYDLYFGWGCFNPDNRVIHNA